MTIRIPRSVVIFALTLAALSAIGVGAYAYGRHSRDTEVQRGIVAAYQLAQWKHDEATHVHNTWRLLRNLCQEVIRISPAAGYFVPDDCNHYGLYAPPRPIATVSDQDEWFIDGLVQICSHVARIERPAGDLPQSRMNCVEGLHSMLPPVRLTQSP